MTRKPHLRIESYVRAVQYPEGAADLARRSHEHLVQECEVCRDAWMDLGPLREVWLERLAALRNAEGTSLPPVDDLSIDPQVMKEEDEAVAKALRQRRRIVDEKCELVFRTPPSQRVAKVRRAHRRFRSLLLADMLIDESRLRVRNDPGDAAAIAELVPHVLAWTQKRRAIPEAEVLLARSHAHRANALRILGDLPAAEQVFIALRRRLAERPLDDPPAMAELASLEASLWIDQRRYQEADALLEQATALARDGGDPQRLARIHLQHANLKAAAGQPQAADRLWRTAASLLSPDHPDLLLSTVAGRVNVLCDLDRPGEARQLLHDNAGVFEASEAPFAGAIFRGLEARCALGLGDLDAAEEGFAASRDGLLALGRGHDAALASLFLAETLFLAGRTGALRRLATDLVEVFRSRRVAEEALAAMRLLARSVARNGVTGELFGELRRRVEAAAAGRPR